MAQLQYVGAAQAATADLVTKGYVSSLTAGAMSQASVDSLINSGLSGRITKSYVDTQDALNATSAFIDAGDAAKLHLSQIGVNNGIAGLDKAGRVEVSRVPVASTQRWPAPFISPASYNGSSVSATTTETQIFTVSVADPGSAYKLLVTGLVDASVATDGQYPIVNVRQGSTTGPIVASGRGLAETYTGSPHGPVPILPTPMDLYPLILGGTTLYVMLISSSTGTVTASTLRPNLYVTPVPAGTVLFDGESSGTYGWTSTTAVPLTFNRVGPQQGNGTGFTTSKTWQDTSPVGTTVLVAVGYQTGAGAPLIPLTATYNGVSMPVRASQVVGGGGGGYIFGLIGAGTGSAVNVVLNSSSNVPGFNAVVAAYNGVSSFGTPQSTQGQAGSIATITCTSSTVGQRVFNLIGAGGAFGVTFTAYNQTQRFITPGSASPAIVVGDAPGAPSVVFSVNTGGPSPFGDLCLPLNPQ
jgi:hypothetical protein